MATHNIKIKVNNGPPDYGKDKNKKVMSGQTISWTCNYPFGIQFQNNNSPFYPDEPVLSGPANTPVTPTGAVKQAQNLEIYKYTVAVFTGGNPAVVIDDPIIIIDNDGGDGRPAGVKGGRRRKKRVAKK